MPKKMPEEMPKEMPKEEPLIEKNKILKKPKSIPLSKKTNNSKKYSKFTQKKKLFKSVLKNIILKLNPSTEKHIMDCYFKDIIQMNNMIHSSKKINVSEYLKLLKSKIINDTNDDFPSLQTEIKLIKKYIINLVPKMLDEDLQLYRFKYFKDLDVQNPMTITVTPYVIECVKSFFLKECDSNLIQEINQEIQNYLEKCPAFQNFIIN